MIIPITSHFKADCRYFLASAATPDRNSTNCYGSHPVKALCLLFASQPGFIRIAGRHGVSNQQWFITFDIVTLNTNWPIELEIVDDIL